MHLSAPICIKDVDIAIGLTDVCVESGNDGMPGNRVVRFNVFLNGTILGVVDVLGEPPCLKASKIASAIWQELRGTINHHLLASGRKPMEDFDGHAVFEGCSVVDRDLEGAIYDQPIVSVVVCTRNRPESLRNCLERLVDVEYPSFEIFVIDSAPDSDLCEELVSGFCARYPSLHYARELRPGLSRARNLGVSLAKGEIVAFTDDDVIVDRNWLARLVKPFTLSQHIACVTGLVLPFELESEAQVLFEKFAGFSKGKSFDSVIYDNRVHVPDDPLYPYLPAVFGAGANMAFSTAALRQVGRFDETLGPGTLPGCSEDTDYFFRVIEAGLAIAYEPQAIVRHKHRRDMRSLERQLRSYGSGFSAFIAKLVVSDVRHLARLLRRLIPAAQYLFSSRSPRNSRKGKRYPWSLTLHEYSGMLLGPFAYLMERCAADFSQDKQAGMHNGERPSHSFPGCHERSPGDGI